MIDENMSGTRTARFWALALGGGLGPREISEAGLSGNDADETDLAGEESGDCVSCISCVFCVSCSGYEALTNGSILGEAEKVKDTEIFRAWVFFR